MTASILALALAYAFLLFLVLLAIFRSEVGAALKLALAIICFGFYLWHYAALQNYLGWPSASALPERFEMVGRIVVEPDLKRDEPGAIYLWLRDLDSEQSIPRAYRLPYQKQLHRKVDATQQKQERGQRHVGTPIPGGAGESGSIEFEALRRDSSKHKSGSGG